MTEITCNRCGLPIDLIDLHPESLTLDMIPNPDDADSWYVVHGSGEQCEDDRRAYIVGGSWSLNHPGEEERLH